MSALPDLLMSWLAAVPTSFGAGWLLSQGKPASVALIFLLSLMISMDIANRAGLEKGMFYGLAGLMAAILTVVSYTPWMVALKKDPKSAGAKALPISGLLFAVVTLAFAIGFGFMKQKEGGLQGGLITLMYVFVSGSMGYSGAQAKTNPSAKGNTIYMLGLLVLLTMFDVSGALRAAPPVYGPKTFEENFANKASAESVSEQPPNNPFPAERAKLTEAIAVAAAQGKPEAEIEAAKKALKNFNAQVVKSKSN
jgi:hypothetical protein